MSIHRGEQPELPITNWRMWILFTKTILFIACPILLSGCLYPGESPVPTAYPSDYLPTVVALTGQAAYAIEMARTPISQMPSATHAIEPSLQVQTSTPEPTITPTPEPGFGDYAQIRFYLRDRCPK
jgi:hypothetical protein